MTDHDLAPPMVLVSDRPWNADLAARLTHRTGRRFHLLSTRDEFTRDHLDAIEPRYVFVPHWSYYIPEEVYAHHECVIFHMTDLPYGRGGSPLQNLIARGHDTTVVSALRCVEEMDAGPIYGKRPLSLHGSAEEIYLRAADVIADMIVDIVADEPTPVPQTGEPVVFARRRPHDSDLAGAGSLDAAYDLIRMVDADGYPHAYVDVGPLRIELRRVTRRVDGLHADAHISWREERS